MNKNLKKIKISVKWLNHLFDCNEYYIEKHCKGRCCEGIKGKILVSLLPNEVVLHRKTGNRVENGLLQPDKATNKCPYKDKRGFCDLHFTLHKPFGCKVSPFTINKNDTLIIRYRYSRLKCHGKGLPAYKTFRTSLNLLFGNENAALLYQLLDKNEVTDNFYTYISLENYNKLKYLDSLK